MSNLHPFPARLARLLREILTAEDRRARGRSRGRSRDRRAGFTLIELLAVILIIGILSVFLIPRIPEAIDRANVTACEKNLGEIYKGFVMHEDRFHDLPQASGVKFFASLISRKVYENTKGVARKLTCPAVKPSALSTLAGRDAEEWFADFDHVDGQSSAYAGRNMKDFPLRKFPGSGKEPLVADDNDGGMNHDNETLVLYADGSVQHLDNVTLTEKGVLNEGETLVVGPDSQVEELRVLSLD